MKKKLRTLYAIAKSLTNRLYYGKPLNKIKRKIHGKNNKIVYGNAILTSVSFNILGDNNSIEIRDDCFLNNVEFNIHGDDHKVIIKNGCRFNTGGNIWFEDHNCLLVIDQYSTFENANLALTEPCSRIIIGQNCMLAYDIDVRTGDSHSIISKESNERINYAEDIFIGDHVWIAAHCYLLKGTTIPNDSVVATGSVVTKKHKIPNTIIGGNPAKEIKHGVTWSRERIYKKK